MALRSFFFSISPTQSVPMLSVLARKVLIKNENKSFVAERARQIHFFSQRPFRRSASAMIESRINFNLCFRLVIDAMKGEREADFSHVGSISSPKTSFITQIECDAGES
jgi:hypothetical protein